MMRTACPEFKNRLSSPAAAWDVAMISSVTGAVIVSWNRTANPSIAELSNGGSFTFECKSSANIRWCASSMLTVSTKHLSLCCCVRCIASSRGKKYGISFILFTSLTSGLLRQPQRFVLLRYGVVDSTNLWDVVLRTLVTSGSATIIAGFLGITLAIFLTNVDWRIKPILRGITQALYGLPPVVVGVVVYIGLSNGGVFGSLNWLFTIQGMIVAQTLLIFPLVLGISWTALERVSEE